MDAETVRQKYADQLLQLPNVNLVGIGKKSDKDVIVVFVTTKVPKTSLAPDQIIPEELEGYEVDVVEGGPIMAHSELPKGKRA